MKILIDSREQNPYSFSGFDVEPITTALPSGDYSLPGFTDRVAVERKELNDLLGCLTHDRDRFKRELERLRSYESAALVIEAPFEAIAAGAYRSRMVPEAAIQSLYAIMAAYRMPVFFAGDRDGGEQFVFDFLRHCARHAERRWKAVCNWKNEKSTGKPLKATKGGNLYNT